jgi:hypothetical protein
MLGSSIPGIHLWWSSPPGAALSGSRDRTAGLAVGVERLLGNLGAVSLRLALAASLGWLAAYLIHVRRIHWRWAALAAAASLALCVAGHGALLARVPLVGALGAPGLVIAWAIATRLSRQWQAAEAEVGGQCPDGRLMPSDVLRRLRRPLGEVAARRIGPARKRLAGDRDGLLIGRTPVRSLPVRIPPRHTIVLGATGSGKTMTLRRILQQATRTAGVIAVDGKGDQALAADLARFAGLTGRRFSAWSPYDSVCYDPFAHGDDTEIVDKALAAESWGDDYYLRLGQRFLGFAVRALRVAGRHPTLAELARYVDPENLEELAPAMEAAEPGSWNAMLGVLPSVGPAERQAIAGTQHRLAITAESDLGDLLSPAPGREVLDLLETVIHGDVAYFNLNADARPQLSRMVGAAIVMDLVSIAATAQRRGEHLPTAVLFDDVQAFATEATVRGLTSLFARGRSAGMMLFLGTQSLADLGSGTQRGAMEQLLDNRVTLVVHRIPGSDSAARASRELGNRPQAVLSEQLEGASGRWRQRGTATRRSAMVPYYLPSELGELSPGVAVVSVLGAPPQRVCIEQPD